MTALEAIDERLVVHRKRLAQAEGKYRKLGQIIPERRRRAVFAACRREQAIILELEHIKEVVEHGCK